MIEGQRVKYSEAGLRHGLGKNKKGLSECELRGTILKRTWNTREDCERVKFDHTSEVCSNLLRDFIEVAHD
jgi:hypothetical protein